MAMKPKSGMSKRPMSRDEGLASLANKRAMRPGGAADRDGADAKGGVGASKRPKKNPKY